MAATCLLLAETLLLAACGAYADPLQTPHPSTTDRAEERCDFAPVEPTYLPWLDKDQEVPPPIESYDKEIDRAQEAWVGPNGQQVGLTRYPLGEFGEPGEPIGVEIDSAEGQLHEGEGQTFSIAWDIDDPCNFVELIMALPGSDVEELREELLKTARSLGRRD
jgi:hypothetical protein